MKDSGVEWLGKVPAHWKIVPPAILFTDSKERARPGDQMLSSTQKYGVIPLAEFESLEQRQVTKASTNFEMRKHVEIGDFVISMRSMDGGLERSHAVGSVRSSYSVLKASDQVHGPYFGALMKCSLYIQALRLTSSFIRDGQDLSFNHVKKIKLPLPDWEEQVAIAEYLDRATTRIDSLVAKKTRFIELLREKRQGVITHAVTKGLNPGVSMRDSGVEWLGEVPGHWEVLRFKQSIVSCQNGLWGEEPNGTDDIECVRVADFNRRSLAVNEHVPTLRAIPQKDRLGRLLKRGNLLLEKSGGGENQPVGQVVMYAREVQAMCSNFLAKIELAPAMDCRFWNYQHHAAYSARINVRSIKQTSGIQNLDQHQYLSEMACFPPFNEQVQIADYLDGATSSIDTLIAKTERSIELLREHRIALITSAVTGKIDLRDAA